MKLGTALAGEGLSDLCHHEFLSPQWIDPLTIWHFGKSTIGYADGHAVVHAWQEELTRRMSREHLFNQPCRDSRDWEFMRVGWAIRE